MKRHYLRRWLGGWLMLVIFVGLATQATARTTDTQTLYLPLMLRNAPWASPFGFESGNLANPLIAQRAAELDVRWVRLNVISWRQVQPNPGDPYNWAALASFEQQLATATQLGLTPLVIVDDYPLWATSIPSSCAAIRDDRMVDFAQFMAALVARYPQVQYWEMGNEPDVDPTLVPPNQVYGCWGDIADPYYGGERYGRMLNTIAPAMRATRSAVRIVIGGLLLDTPNTTNPALGKPERFLEGVLRAGAAPSFDVVAYHAYSKYQGGNEDPDLSGGWTGLGGRTAGKAAFIRQILAQYGTQKPLFLDEISLICDGSTCATDAVFLDRQATHVLHSMTRALHADIKAITWYTLDGPGWRNGGLLDSNQNPRPSFVAYRTFVQQLQNSDLPAQIVDYGPQSEAYRFGQGAQVVDVLWSRDELAESVGIPQANFIAAYTRDGAPITPVVVNGQSIISVPASGVYLHRTP